MKRRFTLQSVNVNQQKCVRITAKAKAHFLPVGMLDKKPFNGHYPTRK
jgi:hypothetical protein